MDFGRSPSFSNVRFWTATSVSFEPRWLGVEFGIDSRWSRLWRARAAAVMWLSDVNSVSFNTPYVDALSFSVTAQLRYCNQQLIVDCARGRRGTQRVKSESDPVRIVFDRRLMLQFRCSAETPVNNKSLIETVKTC